MSRMHWRLERTLAAAQHAFLGRVGDGRVGNWPNLLGGWVQKRTAARYIKTAEHRIRIVQDTTAAHLREALNGRDLVDEGKLFHDLKAILLARGLSATHCDRQIDKLRWSAIPGSIPNEVGKVSVPCAGADVILPQPDWMPEVESRSGASLPADLREVRRLHRGKVRIPLPASAGCVSSHP